MGRIRVCTHDSISTLDAETRMRDGRLPTLGSLFAGIGGIDLGFERAGFETVWQVEINSYCRKVLARHFPNAERFEDVRTVGRHNLKPVDVIAGGFPCQDISNAGKRAGIEGERSGLWSEYARIIGELRPKYVLVENVSALLGRGMGRVLGDLSTLGYDAEWEIISAADVGAPHLRERVWIVAYAQHDGLSLGWRDEDISPLSFELRGICGDERSGSDEQAGATLADSHSRDAQRVFAGSIDQEERGEPRERSTGSCDAGSGGQWEIEPNVGRVAHGVPSRVDRLRGLGNAVVPQIPELIANRIRECLEAA